MQKTGKNMKIAKTTAAESSQLIKDLAKANTKTKKSPKYGVKVVDRLEDMPNLYIKTHKKAIEKLCAEYRRNVVLAQIGDNVYVNSGAVTTYKNIRNLTDNASVENFIRDSLFINDSKAPTYYAKEIARENM